jgi:hypothetical protein
MTSESERRYPIWPNRSAIYTPPKKILARSKEDDATDISPYDHKTPPPPLQLSVDIVGLNRQMHLLEEDIMRRSDSTYVDPILHAQMHRSDSTCVDPIPRARMRRSNSTYVDPILHARLGIAEIQNRTRGAENKANSEQ